MNNIFEPNVTQGLIARINQLKPESPGLWGIITLDPMPVHCSLAYEMAFTNKHTKPNALMRFLLKTFVKREW